MEPIEERSAQSTETADLPAPETATPHGEAPQPPQKTKADYRMIAFSLAGRDYGIDIMKIKEISHEGKFTYVPNAAPYVLGVHNLRGEIIPVIDLRRMFNLAVPEVRAGGELNTLILKLEKIVLGVVVDSIEGVMSTPADSVQPPHPIFSDINMQYISGVVEKDGRLFVILDVESIFMETAQAPKQVLKMEKMPVPAAVVKGADEEFRFVCEGLATFGSFFVTSLNVAWVEHRFEEWKKARAKAGGSVQLGGVEDAREFLAGFASPRRSDLWDDPLRKALVSILPSRPTGTFTVWNHGCGRGFDAYSLVCTLKAAFPELSLKTWANDGNLVEIASAPSLTLPKDRIPPFYLSGGFMRETETGFQFHPQVRESIIFEYTESLSHSENLEADLVLCRDVVSFQRPDAQKALLATFLERLKPEGLLIVGANERLEGEQWRVVEEGGLRGFVKVVRKE